ncbi:peptide MFS transporter [Wolbachia endosymbiont of Drosophila pseudotakahashii]|uniref:peptide MFS transporter n=1 Tax=Wolbachia endosymbiont of Drosophila pseudotakahashii TaxID=375919 RepID=UPI00222EC180|nr:oligopeptide:H+ symporter [Wolbachia endosymbiont of Drosophila pseudotakahashii]MCX3064903.1 oligopeptide:H+ symporter [Wolbachia endosymbiont of Drosophila pseudotakahashii]UZE38078.1 oligopeptide:H+ symporter [Wolbachia endosymbiont of Drosophila pseudotakahashii]
MDQKTDKFPQFLKMLCFVEMWERFSYYGTRVLLVLFLTSHLGFTDERAFTIYALFAATGYAIPILGGFLADKLMGFRNMVLLGGIVMIAGHACMSLVKFEPGFLYLGLSIIAIGTGMFKGNATNLLGSCYGKDDPERSRGFTLFYVSVNIGAILASISCGYVAHLFGWHYGFGLAGIGMSIGLIFFLKFQNLLGDSGLSPYPELMNKRILGIKIFGIVLIGSFLSSSIIAKMLIHSEFFTNMLIFVGITALGIFIYIISKLSAEQRRKLVALSILVVFFLCFFALEMQLGSLVNLFTERNVINNVLGITIPASVSQAINPLSIIIFGFLFGTYMKFKQKYATSMFTLGLLTMAMCFFTLYIGCLNSNIEGKVEYLYLIVAISFMGLGELCIAPLVQEQATTLAPKNLRGVVMGIVMLSLAFSNLAGVAISKFMSVPSVNGKINYLESLEIYKEGFLKVGIFNLMLVIVFLFFFNFIHKVVTNSSCTKN